MIPQDPLMSITVEDSETGVVGFVAIHNFGEQGGCGGVRALPDVSMHEVKELARAMAYKYAFFRLSQGGAKAGLRMDYTTPTAERERLVKSFGSHIALLLSTRAYVPWTDMNFNGDDLSALFAGASLTNTTTRTQSANRTALSTFAALMATAEHLGLPPQQCRVALEGFGNVGGTLAQLINDWGGKVVALSNTLGAVVNEDGLDVSKLVALRREVGQECVTQSGEWENVPRTDLFSLPADILVPGARVHAIDEQLAGQLQVQAIVPAANVPCTSAAEGVLNERGVLLLPDFVVNGGGVLGIVAGDGSESTFFRTEFKDMFARLLKSSQERSESPIAFARGIADFNYQSLDCTFLRQPSFRNRVADLMKRVPLVSNGSKKHHEQRKKNLRNILETYFTPAHEYEHYR